MLQWLYTYVASVYSKCFICFSNVCYKCVYLYVAYVSLITLQVFYLGIAYVFQWSFKCFQVFWQVFQTYVSSVSNTCFKCFICLHTYVANVSSGCFKNRSGVAVGHPPATAGVQAEGSRGGASGLRAGSGGVRTVRAPMNGVQARASGHARPGASTALYTILPCMKIIVLYWPI
jgi:hypothetical protein